MKITLNIRINAGRNIEVLVDAERTLGSIQQEIGKYYAQCQGIQINRCAIAFNGITVFSSEIGQNSRKALENKLSLEFNHEADKIEVSLAVSDKRNASIVMRCNKYLQSDESDREKILRLVNTQARIIRRASEYLRKNEDFILETIRLNAKVVLYMEKSLKNNRLFMLKAIQENSEALKYAPDQFRKDTDFIRDAVNINGFTLRYAPLRHWLNPVMVVRAGGQIFSQVVKFAVAALKAYFGKSEQPGSAAALPEPAAPGSAAAPELAALGSTGLEPRQHVLVRQFSYDNNQRFMGIKEFTAQPQGVSLRVR